MEPSPVRELTATLRAALAERPEIARDPAATTTREGRALSRYCDFVPQLAKIERAASARIRAGVFGR